MLSFFISKTTKTHLLNKIKRNHGVKAYKRGLYGKYKKNYMHI